MTPAALDDDGAARPHHPAGLHDRLALHGRVLELGAGTGIATRSAVERADVVATDLGPRVLGRLHALLPQVPVAVARALPDGPVVEPFTTRLRVLQK